MFVEIFDLDGEVQGQLCFQGDVVGQVRVLEFVGPERERFVGRCEQPVGVGSAPGAAGMAMQEPCDECPARPSYLVRSA
ncbi:hypothetical protein [Kibdelosporangium phytohabitans]|uniref:Uncharacterized protein n=1 Tax=Kibdelosporangium phytohabitans TaxID=860235 RepID=A0A0N9HRP1_9PSEU|nr:hypothetical protein [Kibdelosporangium phytohabitans]ALG07564.1 hypothetical protein AOZ06_12145 [Kibdelosporangium phytohabitans]MBE1471503.1 hypothetical protein [Kibdelosporangium phytohabitans]